MGWGPLLRRASLAALGVGAGFHTAGIIMRMLIMGRPPVSTLYESIIFVALIAVLFGLILEVVRKNGIGLLISTVAGASLHFIGIGYASEGETMGQLVAVLNTNFWLATHVVTITIGYGCCFVAGIVGHIYLLTHCFRPNDAPRLRELNNNMLGIGLFALFFALFGTILGGIWADQSWGRFWGWDPKENGALLIVLWLLFLLHGRLAGMIKPLGFAFGMVITNIVVAVAWFGVNLLNVGLHSYGFTDSIALNLGLFCGGELLFGIVTYTWARSRQWGATA
jgi:ABC-type transport system involved in cytochrome c biogenesis permease subunit